MNSKDRLEALPDELEFEFDYLGDCIWKLNEQLDVIRQNEIAKLELYHPNDLEAQGFRWMFEGPKHDSVFPTALNYSFVVLVFITLETRLMRLTDLLYEVEKFPVRAKDMSGSGLERYLSYLSKLAGVNRSKLPNWLAISKLGIIRNCIVHTSGIINYSNDAQEIRSMIKNRSYLTETHRARFEEIEKRKGEKRIDYIEIALSDEVEKLVIKREYTHAVSAYARDFLLQILGELGVDLHGKELHWLK